MKFAALAALLAGTAIAIAYAWLRRRGRDPLEPRPTGELPDTAVALFAGLVMWWTAQYTVAASDGMDGFAGMNGRTFTVIVFSVSNVVIAAALLRTALSGSFRTRLPVTRVVAAGVLTAVVLFAGQIVYMVVIDAAYKAAGLTLPMQNVVEDARNATGLDLSVRVVAAIALAPFAEEVFFRGILLPAAVRSVGPVRGLLVQAVAFGFIHCVNQWRVWPHALALSGVGWLAGWLFLRTGSLSAPIVLHATFNAANFVALRMSEGASRP